MDGIIVLNKEANMTSNDCVIKLKKILHPDKIGHTGTLDPNVTGVLPICLGKATKLVETMMNEQKTYLCTICLGIKTETEDFDGKIIEEMPVDEIFGIDDALTSFLGDYYQTPPMYSALKYKGKRLYEYARENIVVPREARKMHIYNIKRTSEITFVDHKCYFTFRVTGSKGLYVRTLCTDIAQKLKVIGCMKSLVREQTASFTLADSYTLDDIKNGNYKIISIEEYFKSTPFIEVSEYMAKMVKNGIYLDERQLVTTGYFRVYYQNKLIAIYKTIEEKKYSPLIIL